VDNGTDVERKLLAGARDMGIPLGSESAQHLTRYLEEMVGWNRKVNLTAIVDPAEMVEKHLLDSLAILPELEGRRTLLDIGTGAGLPGLPLAVCRPDLGVTVVDSVAKKIGFIKHVAAQLRLPNLRAIHARAGGHPDREGLPLAEAVVSRALADPAEWLPLARRYLEAGGRVVAMLGRAPADLEDLAGREGLRCLSVRRYLLPWSRAERRAAVFEPGGP
jgi:16S rRNA (guanine527-N7)-methyltransferase